MKIQVLILTLLMLFGCATTSENPKSFMDTLDVTLSAADGSQTQKNVLYKSILEKLHEENRFEASPHPSRPAERYSRFESVSYSGINQGQLVYRGGTNMDYQYTYFIDANNRLVKNTLNYSWHFNNKREKDCLLCLDHGFTEYSDGIALKAANIYNSLIGKYLSAVNRNKEIEGVLNKEIDKVSFKINNSLPVSDKVIDFIISRATKRVESGDIRYSVSHGLQVYEPYISIGLPPAHGIDRFGVITEVLNDNIKLGGSPNVTISLTDGFYDLLPIAFVAENNDIGYILSDGKLTVRNKTNDFIKIHEITVYAGDKADTVSLNSILLPPQTFITENLIYKFDIFRNLEKPRIISLKRPAGKFFFGIAVSYSDAGSNKYDTLLRTKNFSMQDFQ